LAIFGSAKFEVIVSPPQSIDFKEKLERAMRFELTTLTLGLRVKRSVEVYEPCSTKLQLESYGLLNKD